MNDIDGVYLFVRTVDAGSFSAAARRLRVTPSAISKKVARLEDRLGVMLLNRTSRKLALTDAGRDLYRTCSQSLTAIDEAREAVSRLGSEVRGLLRVALGQGFGRLHIVPLIPLFMARHPEISIDLLFGRLSGTLFDDQVDVTISPNDPPDSNLIIRPLFPYDRVTCAAPSYLERHGRPKSVDELSGRNCLVFINPNSLDSEWAFAVPGGRRGVRVTGNFRTNNHEALYDAALSGLGIAHMPSYVVAPALESGQLISLFQTPSEPREEGARETMNAYFPRTKNRLKKVTVFVDFLIDHFRDGVRFGELAR